MTAIKAQYAQYLRELDNIFTQVIFENMQSFRETLLDPSISNVLEVYYSGSDVMVFAEYDERAMIHETISAEDFVDWLVKTQAEEDGPDEAA